MRNAKMVLDHRRERLVSLVSLVRLSSELALPVEGGWLACDLRPDHSNSLLTGTRVGVVVARV